MKIVLTAHQFLPDHWSGTEVITYTLAKELQARGHDVTIVTAYPTRVVLEDSSRFDEYCHDGIPVVRFHHDTVPMGGQDNVVEAEYFNHLFRHFFIAWLREKQPDLVHFLHLGRLTSSAIEACSEVGVPTMFSATDFWLVCPTNQLRLPSGAMCRGPEFGGANCVKHFAQLTQPGKIADRLTNIPLWILRAGIWAVRHGAGPRDGLTAHVRALADRKDFLIHKAQLLRRIIVPSRLMAEVLISNGLPAERVEIIPYGIDLRRIRRDTDRGGKRALRVMFAGTLAEHKGAHLLVQAMRTLPADLPLELKLYGRTDELPAYVQTLEDMIGRDNRIRLCGAFQPHEVGAVLSQADVLVCPSIWYENTPMIIYEAMAAGVPVVATDLRGMSESVEHEVNGLLFPNGDIGQLAAQLRRLVEDRNLVRSLSVHTRLPMSLVDHVTRVEELYFEVAGKRERQHA